MYELHFRDTAATTPTATASTSAPQFSVARIAEAVNLAARLADRERLPPAELDAALAARSDAHSLAAGGGKQGGAGGDMEAGSMSTPGFPVDRLFPGTFYLDGISGDRTRSYSRRPIDAARARGGTLAPSLARKAADEEVLGDGRKGGGSGGEEEAATATTTSGTEASVSGEEEGEEEEEEKDAAAASAAVAATVSSAASADTGANADNNGSADRNAIGSADANGDANSDASSDANAEPNGVTAGGDPSTEVATEDAAVAVVASASAGDEAEATVASKEATTAAAAATDAVSFATAVSKKEGARAAELSSPLTGIAVAVGPGARLGALLPRVVVTGVACGLPGQDKVFEEDNLARLLDGQNCVQQLSAASVAALVEKNVVQVRNGGRKGEGGEKLWVLLASGRREGGGGGEGGRLFACVSFCFGCCCCCCCDGIWVWVCPT